ncbi:ADP-ribosylglycohydrolase family protein [Loigolactobacillus zhaoyuanensis]|uniref:ADP-ribosylglycohydrolase family protein n=1 Tax=Loigolactobacillus zhaoyuanensis TaxID=2486017 RepID=UPI000F740DC0|nr:ADP-ribosylglycohydrolase family protein [Loigolactobacillus zhaoyuanensis]
MQLTQRQLKQFIYAGLVGDALGVPVEFKPRDSYRIDAMLGFGTYDQPAGSWSDDSSLTLCLMENLTENGSMVTLFDKMLAYMTTGKYTPNHELFDIGNATRRAILNYSKGVSPLECGDRSEFANGNGAIMRIAPLAIILLTEKDFKKRSTMIREYTILTHAHERSVIGSVIYVELLRELLLGTELTVVLGTLQQRLQLVGFTEVELAKYQCIFDRGFGKLPRAAIKSSGYVIDSLAAAIWCNLVAHDFQEVTLLAVNLGEDTDTVAQLAAMINVSQKLETVIPDQWQQALIIPPEIHTIITDFTEKFGD